VADLNIRDGRAVAAAAIPAVNFLQLKRQFGVNVNIGDGGRAK
jgi:hypothetical protein